MAIDNQPKRGNYITPFRAFRINAHISIKQLAEATGIPTGTLYCYDNGKYKPSSEHANKLSQALHTGIDGLFPEGLRNSCGYNWIRGTHRLGKCIEGSDAPEYDPLESRLAREEVYSRPAEGADPAEIAASADIVELFYTALKAMKKDVRAALYVKHSDDPLDCEKVGLTQEEIVAVVRKGRDGLRRLERTGMSILEVSKYAPEFMAVINNS